MPKAHILIVEDENIVALDLQNRLIGLGYEVLSIVRSGEQAVRSADRLRPDLVLMDIHLQGEMDGIKAAQQIRARYDIPIVFLTAFGDDATLQEAKISGPFGYILKPFDERMLAVTIEMALHKHTMERELRESERWWATTLRSIGDAVIATDAQGNIKFMNPAAENMTGWKLQEASGVDARQVVRLVESGSDLPVPNPIVQVLQTDTVLKLEGEARLISRDGTQIPIGDSAAPIRDENGTLTGVVLVFRDITEQVRSAEALQRYTEDLREQNQELDAFAHTVAHDLKNPLNLIVGFSQVLEKEYPSMSEEQLKHYLQIIANSGIKMGNIIDELLLLATARRADVVTEPLDMADIVAEAQNRLTLLILEHKAEIELPDQWPVALGYGPWVEEVWVNYISNGIKYGGQPPRLTLGASRQTDGIVAYWVHDNGPGLSPEDQSRLFTPFTQISKVRVTGHGLGLSIVRRIVERLGGVVGVESPPEGGSTFFFTLPAADPDSTTPNQEPQNILPLLEPLH